MAWAEGDVVQFTVVLKHLRRHRPNWEVTVRCGRGKHTALLGHCHRVSHDQEPDLNNGDYQSVAHLGWYENYSRYTDRPNSKITNCLAEVFGIGYDLDLCRYEIAIPDETFSRCNAYFRSIGAEQIGGNKFNVVLIHGQGNTSTWKKNLAHWQMQAIVDFVLRAGRVPVILDWDNRSPLPDQKRIFCPRPGEGDLWGSFGSGDAATIAGLVTLSEAYVGIDSGPGKCASATKTPSLHCWIGHHPIQFHDPAEQTMHLIPAKWREIPPAEHPGVAAYFEKHYHFRTYVGGEHGLVAEARQWLSEILSYKGEDGMVPTPFVLPAGIGDVMWALHKIRPLADGKPIDVILSGDPREEINRRTLPFLKRFRFVRSATVLDIPILEDKDNPNDSKGRYKYIADGNRGGYHFLMPNKALEEGKRLEEWLPDVPCDWSIVNEFDWSDTDKGAELAKTLAPFAVFYLGPERGNVEEGHNRGFQWEPKHWVALGKALMAKGLRIAVVGAHYDRSYWERYVEAGVREEGMKWHDFLGRLEIGETLALIRGAKLVISYQSGIGIMAHYLGVPTAIWWRKDGDSAHPERLVSFDERMASGWTNPAIVEQGKFLPLIYRRETVEDIMQEIEKKGWLK